MRNLSWNVQGLGGDQCKRFRGRLRQDLQKCLIGGPIDIIMIQEHHLNKVSIDSYGNILSGNWRMYWSEAFGHHHRKGGVCVTIAGQRVDKIVAVTKIIPGGVKCLTFKLDPNVVGIVLIYTLVTMQ
jgi:exonuclease III